ncbi:DUF3520 domain-containing protein [Lujinxingia vulgaris]|uniref:DUF3520 domain-containing protein n=2 Tax=Lujinxingia vulgaris TaxID=2600176 RepID=A0A5C6X6D8_9DELT|nr:DUF3520 domain-containing protein [Lujinxingia vulgaris]
MMFECRTSERPLMILNRSTRFYLGILAALVVVAICAVKLFGTTVASKFQEANEDVSANCYFGPLPSDPDAPKRSNVPDHSSNSSSDRVANAARRAALREVAQARSGAPEVYIPPPTPRTPPPARLALDPPARAIGHHNFTRAAQEPTSTFSIDVNTASYTASREAIMRYKLPHPDSVRPEEFLNFFEYDYNPPTSGEDFSIQLDMLPSYFGSTETPRQLVRVGIRGADVPVEEMKASNLVFLVDVSGSMGLDTRLPAAKIAMRTLVERLRPDDTVAIQTYASGTHTILEPTPVADRDRILRAIDGLIAKGTTRGDAGIVKAYELARQGFIEEGNNRVLIFSDGDFNVGPPGEDLAELIRSYRDDHITVTTVAMGLGSKDDIMEKLARDTNGNYFYIDTPEEAERIFSEKVVGTLQVLAADVKIQVDFNPDYIANYRLIGYEKRAMANEDFDNDEVDAAELGPGHTVTAFYEVELTENAPATSAELARVDVRYKKELGAESQLVSRALTPDRIYESFDKAPAQLRFAATVAGFAESLRVPRSNAQVPPFDELLATAAQSAYAGDPDQVELAALITRAHDLWVGR